MYECMKYTVKKAHPLIFHVFHSTVYLISLILNIAINVWYC